MINDISRATYMYGKGDYIKYVHTYCDCEIMQAKIEHRHVS